MKKKQRFFARIFLCVLCVATTVSAVVLSMRRDKKGPVITVPEDGTITYRAEEDKKILLEGVTAVDEKDGDVSDTLMVESVRQTGNNDKAVVTYTALDHSHNVSKASCIVKFQQEDQKPEAEEIQESEQEEQEEQEQDSAEVSEEALPEGSPQLRLSEHEVTLSVGSKFDYSQYIADITDDKDSRSELYRNIHLDGKVDTGKPGSCQISYYVWDSDGNQSNIETLTVKVQ